MENNKELLEKIYSVLVNISVTLTVIGVVYIVGAVYSFIK